MTVIERFLPPSWPDPAGDLALRPRSGQVTNALRVAALESATLRRTLVSAAQAFIAMQQARSSNDLPAFWVAAQEFRDVLDAADVQALARQIARMADAALRQHRRHGHRDAG